MLNNSGNIVVGVAIALLCIFLFAAYVVGYGIDIAFDKNWSIQERFIVGLAILIVAGAIGGVKKENN